MNTSTNNSRDDNVQILRFVAAALVLLTHVTFYIHERIDPSVNVWHGGETGVAIFFLISGFVMYFSGEKLPHDADGAATFFRRRIVRIFPLYWFFTVIKVGVAIAAPSTVLHNKPNITNILASFVLFPVFNGEGEVRPLHGVAWTLLHEMLFYYVFTAALFLRRTPIVFTSIVIVALWALHFFVPPVSAMSHIAFSELNLLFVTGMFLGMFHLKGFRISPSLAWVGILAATFCMLNPTVAAMRFHYLGGFDLSAVFVLLCALSIQILPILSTAKQFLVRLGDSSYALYMIHPIAAPAVCVTLLKLHVRLPLVVAPVAVLVCIAIGHLVHLFIEVPLSAAFGKLIERLSLLKHLRYIRVKE